MYFMRKPVVLPMEDRILKMQYVTVLRELCGRVAEWYGGYLWYRVVGRYILLQLS